MNSELQKKWFVYLSDHHEGPFSAVELSQKHKAGSVSPQSYVWSEGMVDWKPLMEVSELAYDLKKLETVSHVSPAEEREVPSDPEIKKKPKNSKFLTIIGTSMLALLALSIITLAILSRSSNEEFHASIRPTLFKVIDHLPFMSSIIRLVPSTSELKPTARKELEEAQLGSPETNVRLSVALAQNDPNRPTLYVGTNLPDHIKLDLYLIGNDDTLLNRLQFKTQMTIIINHGLGKTDVLLTDDGQPLPKGEYQLWVTESQDQEELIKDKLAKLSPSRPAGALPPTIPVSAKFVMSSTIFIGGVRDESYLTHLKAFHEKIKQSSEKELIELRQYADTLTLQYQTLSLEFGKILRSRKPTESQKRHWKLTSDQWQAINAQLEQTIQTWSKETLQNEFFYGNAYELVKSAYDSIKNLFTIENAYVIKSGSLSAFEIQHGKALSESRQTLDQLRGKIDLILKAPKSPNGLPRRE